MNVSLLERLGLGALVCAWLIYGSNFIGNLLVQVDEPEVVAVRVAPPPVAEPVVPEPEVDFATLLAAATPDAGARVYRRCVACHTIEEGGPHRVGPNLHNIVGKDIAAKEGFNYSGVLAGLEGSWTHERLDAFLENPSGYAPGNRMTFAGLRNARERADVIAYLRANTDDPPPLPEPEVVTPTAEPDPPSIVDPGPPEVIDEPATEVMEEAAAVEGGGAGSITSMIAAASADDGQRVYRRCVACHTIDEGGPHRVGPNLHNIVGKDIASKDGYNYSNALKNVEGEWTYEKLWDFIHDPRGFAPGNKMTFAGIKRDDELAAVIAYLKENTESPPPLE
ncbi:MAG: cytochrome c family protein [Rhodospirillales bacterium]|nr:MAG: cytochrome c family protein [Rhodospirillales bacterium]